MRRESLLSSPRSPRRAAPTRRALWLRRLAPLAVFLAVIAVLLGPALVGARTVLPHDLLLERPPWSLTLDEPVTPTNVELRDQLSHYYPIQHALWRGIGEGEASWLEDLSLGMPGVRFIGWGALSPFNLPALGTAAGLVPFDLAWSWAMGLRLLAAMGGAFLLARALGVGRAAATIAGVAFGLSGFMTGWLGWPQTHVGALAPWTLWTAWRCAGPAPPWWAGPALAVATAALWLGGFPAVSVYVLVAAGVVALAAAWQQGAWPAALRGLGAAAAAVVAGTALAAFTLLPSTLFLDELALGFRETAWAVTPPLTGLATFVVPGLFGDVVHQSPWLGATYVETIGYAGVVTLALAVPAWLLVPRRRGLGLFTGLGLGFLALVYGLWPLRELIALVPLLRTNAPTRAVVLVGLAIAVVGAFGADALVRAVRGQARLERRALLVAGGLALAVVVGLAWVRPVSRVRGLADGLPPEQVDAALRFAAARGATALGLCVAAAAVVGLAAVLARRRRQLAVAVVGVGLVAVVAVDLTTFAAGWNVQVARAGLFPDAPGLAALEAASVEHRVAGADGVGHPNTHLEYGFADVRAHTFVTARQREVLTRARADFRSPTRWDLDALSAGAWQPWLQLLGVRTVLDAGGAPTLGGVLVQPEAAAPLGALGPDDVAEVTVPAPRAGALTGVQLRVATYGAAAAGALVVQVRTDEAARETRVPAEALTDLAWVLAEVPPLPVAAEEPVTVTVSAESATTSGPAPLAVLGRPAPSADTALDGRGKLGAPALSVVYAEAAPAAAPLADTPLRLVTLEGALPRIRAVPDAEPVAPGEALERIAEQAPAGAAAPRLGGRALVEPYGEAPLPGLPDGDAAEVVAWQRRGATVHARVRTAGGGLVVLAEQAFAGWRAQVDGAPAPLVVADHLYVGVVVPDGEHTVTLTYRMPGARAGDALSLAAAAALAVWTALAAWTALARHRRPRTSPLGDGAAARRASPDVGG